MQMYAEGSVVYVQAGCCTPSGGAVRWCLALWRVWMVEAGVCMLWCVCRCVGEDMCVYILGLPKLYILWDTPEQKDVIPGVHRA